MQDRFYQLADRTMQLLQEQEFLTCNYSAEVSDFVRFNVSKIRQPGRVTQSSIALDLTNGRRHTSGLVTLSGDEETDLSRVKQTLETLRQRLPHLPEDPHHLYATEVQSSERLQENRLPRPEEAIESILDAGKGRDLVGIYAAGGLHRGFANSIGQRNWFSSYNFNFDWSFYHEKDKAVKASYAGFQWDPSILQRKADEAIEQLGILSKPARTIEPGRYRVYLTPVAVESILETLAWGGFGLKECKTKQSPLLRLVDGGASFNDAVTIFENTARGVAPNFQSEGFIKPDTVKLVDRGRYAGSLVSPRSAKEYGVPTNGSSAIETPESVEMAPGSLAREQVLQRLETGIWISNLWYLNYSDRPSGRITGMTRFATFWVEKGAIAAPLNVMRFDESVYRMLGEKLIDLTAETELLLDAYTYGERSTASTRVPGALVDDFTLTL